jgi:hypothetical protein
MSLPPTTDAPKLIISFDQSLFEETKWNRFIQRFQGDLQYVVEYALYLTPQIHWGMHPNLEEKIRQDYLEAIETGPHKGMIETDEGLVPDPEVDIEVSIFEDMTSEIVNQIHPVLYPWLDTHPPGKYFTTATLVGRLGEDLVVQIHYDDEEIAAAGFPDWFDKADGKHGPSHES